MNLSSRLAWPLAGVLAACALSAAPAPQRPIRAEVNLVSVHASVLDRDGRPVAGLTAEDFELYEEGRRQAIEVFEAATEQPLDLALMLDSSLSLAKELRFEAQAAAQFLEQLVRPGDGVAIFQFADLVTQLSEFSDQPAELRRALRGITPGAGTSLYDAVFLGAQALEHRPPGRRRVVVLLTDAGETTSSATFEAARRAALRAEAMLYTVLVRPVKSEGGRNTAGEHALVTITDVTGGAIYRPDAAEELPAIFDRIDRELRTQYRLGFYPAPRPPAGAYRRLEVRVREAPAVAAPTTVPRESARTAYEVRYRKGYFAAGVE